MTGQITATNDKPDRPTVIDILFSQMFVLRGVFYSEVLLMLKKIIAFWYEISESLIYLINQFCICNASYQLRLKHNFSLTKLKQKTVNHPVLYEVGRLCLYTMSASIVECHLNVKVKGNWTQKRQLRCSSKRTMNSAKKSNNGKVSCWRDALTIKTGAASDWWTARMPSSHWSSQSRLLRRLCHSTTTVLPHRTMDTFFFLLVSLLIVLFGYLKYSTKLVFLVSNFNISQLSGLII